jgi:hypothetical protein
MLMGFSLIALGLVAGIAGAVFWVWSAPTRSVSFSVGPLSVRAWWNGKSGGDGAS